MQVLSCFSIFLQLALFVTNVSQEILLVRSEMAFIQLVRVLIHAALVVNVWRSKSISIPSVSVTLRDRTCPTFQ